jgi:uncharacterized protein YecA (UPF0149 family)
MGAIAEGFAAYARPLFEETDGSIDAMNRAMAMAQMCWNFALLPEDEREAAIDEMKPALKMTDEVFADFRQKFILPMIHRHHEMFPGLHNRSKQRSDTVKQSSNTVKQSSDTIGLVSSQTKKYPVADRYAPCPCGSGRKYKFCCGAHK